MLSAAREEAASKVGGVVSPGLRAGPRGVGEWGWKVGIGRQEVPRVDGQLRGQRQGQVLLGEGELAEQWPPGGLALPDSHAGVVERP